MPAKKNKLKKKKDFEMILYKGRGALLVLGWGGAVRVCVHTRVHSEPSRRYPCTLGIIESP